MKEGLSEERAAWDEPLWPAGHCGSCVQALVSCDGGICLPFSSLSSLGKKSRTGIDSGVRSTTRAPPRANEATLQPFLL